MSKKTSKPIIECFSAQATGAFGSERDDLMVVQRPLRGEIITREAFKGTIKDLPEYLIDTALEVNTRGERAELLISRDQQGRVHHHLVPMAHV